MNLETIELRFKQATGSQERMLRYTAHALSDMAWMIEHVRSLEARIKELEHDQKILTGRF